MKARAQGLSQIPVLLMSHQDDDKQHMFAVNRNINKLLKHSAYSPSCFLCPLSSKYNTCSWMPLRSFLYRSHLPSDRTNWSHVTYRSKYHSSSRIVLIANLCLKSDESELSDCARGGRKTTFPTSCGRLKVFLVSGNCFFKTLNVIDVNLTGQRTR